MFKFKANLHRKFQDSMERPCLQKKCSSYVTLKFCLAGLKAYKKNLLSFYSPSLQTSNVAFRERISWTEGKWEKECVMGLQRCSVVKSIFQVQFPAPTWWLTNHLWLRFQGITWPLMTSTGTSYTWYIHISKILIHINKKQKFYVLIF